MGKRARANRKAMSGKRRSKSYDKSKYYTSCRSSYDKFDQIESGSSLEKRLDNTRLRHKGVPDESKKLLYEYKPSRVIHKRKDYGKCVFDT